MIAVTAASGTPFMRHVQNRAPSADGDRHIRNQTAAVTIAAGAPAANQRQSRSKRGLP